MKKRCKSKKLNRNYPFLSCKEKHPVIMNTTRLKGGISELLPEGAIFNNPKCNLG